MTVTNTGSAKGTSAAVVDVPATPAGFTITSVTVDDGTAQTAAPFQVTAGDELAVKAAKAHKVVVTYAIAQKDITGWTSLNTCDAAATNPDETKGLFNKVTMTGDSDGVDNNHACVPVNETAGFSAS